MPRLNILDSAVADLGDIAEYIATTSGSTVVAERFTGEIIAKCEHLASLEVQIGRSRQELIPNIRSFPFKGYIIFFRYLPSDTRREVLEVVNILEGSRDFMAYFGNDGE